MAEVIKDLLKIKNKNIWTIEPGATVYDAISEMAHKQIEITAEEHDCAIDSFFYGQCNQDQEDYQHQD